MIQTVDQPDSCVDKYPGLVRQLLEEAAANRLPVLVWPVLDCNDHGRLTLAFYALGDEKVRSRLTRFLIGKGYDLESTRDVQLQQFDDSQLNFSGPIVSGFNEHLLSFRLRAQTPTNRAMEGVINELKDDLRQMFLPSLILRDHEHGWFGPDHHGLAIFLAFSTFGAYAVYSISARIPTSALELLSAAAIAGILAGAAYVFARTALIPLVGFLRNHFHFADRKGNRGAEKHKQTPAEIPTRSVLTGRGKPFTIPAHHVDMPPAHERTPIKGEGVVQSPLDMEVPVRQSENNLPASIANVANATHDTANSAFDCPSWNTSRIAGKETATEARKAVASVLQRNPTLKDLVEKTTLPFEPDKLQYIWTCNACKNGRLHCVGQNCLPDGKAILGGLMICDQCAHYTTKR